MRTMSQKENRKIIAINLSLVNKGYDDFKIGLYVNNDRSDLVLKFEHYKKRETIVLDGINSADLTCKEFMVLAGRADALYREDHVEPSNNINYYRGTYRNDDSDSGVSTLCEECVGFYEETRKVDLGYWEDPRFDVVECRVCGAAKEYKLS